MVSPTISASGRNAPGARCGKSAPRSPPTWAGTRRLQRPPRNGRRVAHVPQLWAAGIGTRHLGARSASISSATANISSRSAASASNEATWAASSLLSRRCLTSLSRATRSPRTDSCRSLRGFVRPCRPRHPGEQKSLVPCLIVSQNVVLRAITGTPVTSRGPDKVPAGSREKANIRANKPVPERRTQSHAVPTTPWTSPGPAKMRRRGTF